MMNAENLKGPLGGIRVLELTHTVMGPTAGMILADLGAEVLKIEKAPDGDDTRRLQGFGAGFFLCFNRNKSSLCLDLKSDQGRRILDRLILKADVLIENFGPGTIERLGFGYERVSGLNPGLIFCSLKGFMPGPYEKRLALDEVVQMMGGLAYMTGPSKRPLRAGASVTDIMGGAFGAIGILAALRDRDRTGKGQMVRASLFESVALMMSQHMAVKALTGEDPPPMPERGRTWSVYDLFETKDGEQVFLGITSDRHWKRFCEAFGYPDLLENQNLAGNQSRIDNRGYLLPELARRLKQMTKAEFMATAEKAAIPFAQVSKPSELFDDPQLNQSGWMLELENPDGKKARLPKLPIALGGYELGLQKQPPVPGSGGGEILLEAGFTPEQLAKWESEGVIRTAP